VQHYIQNECTKNQKQKMAYLFSGDGGDSDSAVVPLVCLRPFPLLLFAFVPVCFILSAALEMMMKVPAFCYWFGCFFLCRDVYRDEGYGDDNSLCMLYFFPLILSVYYFFALGFLLCFLCFFSLFFGLIFRSLLCFWVPFFASGVLTFSALAPPMIFGPLFA